LYLEALGQAVCAPMLRFLTVVYLKPTKKGKDSSGDFLTFLE
jgi:hypothetical protein